jgi:hypothetical protein
MRIPELLVSGGGFLEFGRRSCDIAADQRPVAKHIARAIARLTADFRDALVGGTAVRAGVTAVFHQGDRRIHRSDNMVPEFVDRTIETMGRHHGGRHPGEFVTRLGRHVASKAVNR